MCLGCGFDGRGLQTGHAEPAWKCPRCGADLYSRPPRSYAEMEGLDDEGPLSTGPRRSSAPGITLGFRSISHMDRRRIVIMTPRLGRRRKARHLKPLSVFFGVLVMVVLAATVVSIGVWLPGQF